eukprot:7810803-Alexandrium_andersonii.AAC.1
MTESTQTPRTSCRTIGDFCFQRTASCASRPDLTRAGSQSREAYLACTLCIPAAPGIQMEIPEFPEFPGSSGLHRNFIGSSSV